MSPSSLPERTCVGCRAAADPSRLVRLVRVGRQVAAAPQGQGGRGAWLHPREECLERALDRKAFSRAFRQLVDADAGVLRLLLTRNARKY